VAEYLPKARLFYAASSRVFGKPSSDLQDEATPINPICAYGISKAAGIFLCRAYRRSKSIFAAAGILYNHESPLRPVHFVTRKITRSAARAKLGLRGTLFLNDLHASVDWGAATDFADAMQRIILLNEPDDFIVATGKTSLVREFANAAFSHVGLDPRDFISDFDTHVSPLARRCLCGDYSKLRNSTGWQPRLGLTEIVAEMVDFDLWQLGRETADLMVNASHVLDA
jgi:GDPmannose 4,6-dehydratase